jgi:hypothetical protein
MRARRNTLALLATVVALFSACLGTTGEMIPPAGEMIPPDSGVEDQGGAGDAAGETADLGEAIVPDASKPAVSVDGGLADASDGGPCPAESPQPKQFVVFGDSTAAQWSDYGFSGPTAHESTRVCSGNEAVSYTTSKQYDGFSFTAANAAAVPANHFSARIYVSADSDWSVAAEPLSTSDAHCYRLPFNCGGGDPACGPNQTLTPCIQHWKAGWQTVELAIPASTVKVGAILFEQFSMGPIQIVIDDVRLTQP